MNVSAILKHKGRDVETVSPQTTLMHVAQVLRDALKNGGLLKP